MEHYIGNINQQKKIYNSIDNKHQIKINIIDDVCWFNINKFDFEYYKTFLLVLKDVLIYLRKNNVIYIKQYISEEDTKYFTKSTIVNIDRDQYTITTNINDFVDEIINVFGINKI